MNKESFRILKEINSLTVKTADAEKLVAKELTRIAKIEDQRAQREALKQEAQEKLQESKHELQQIESRIELLSKKLESDKANTNNVFTQEEVSALEQQIESSQIELNQLEEQGLELIELIEGLEQDILDTDSFLAGTLDTIAEIEDDINQENADTYQAIKNNRARIDLLKEQLPEKVISKLEELLAKNFTHGPLVEISAQNSCLSCGYLIPIALINSVENKLNFHTCPGCGRILIPQSTKYM